MAPAKIRPAERGAFRASTCRESFILDETRLPERKTRKNKAKMGESGLHKDVQMVGNRSRGVRKP